MMKFQIIELEVKDAVAAAVKNGFDLDDTYGVLAFMPHINMDDLSKDELAHAVESIKKFA